MRDTPNSIFRTRPFAALLLTSACVVASAAYAPASASAQLLVPADQAPAQDTGAGAASDPGVGPDEQPSGMWVGGGFSFLTNDGVYPGMRAEFGIPLSEDFPLSLILPFTIHGRRDGFGGSSIRSQIFTFLPGLQYEFVLPVEMPGTLTIVGELGLGFGILRAKFVDAFGPDFKDADGAFGIHASVLARYYFESVPQFFVALQPVGVTALIRDGGIGFYEFYVGAGYRFGQ